MLWGEKTSMTSQEVTHMPICQGKGIAKRIGIFLLCLLAILTVTSLSIPTTAFAQTYAGEDAAARDDNSGVSEEYERYKKEYEANKNKSNSAYSDYDASDMAASDKDGSNSKVVSGGIGFIQSITNKVLLPLALLVCVTKVLYIAIFPLVARIDPLDVIDEDSFREGPMATRYDIDRDHSSGGTDPQHSSITSFRKLDWGSKGDWNVSQTPEQIHQHLKTELIGTGKSILIVLIVWSVLNFIMWIITLVLATAHM